METLKAFDVLVPGEYFCDLIFGDLPRLPTLDTEVFAPSLALTVGGPLNTVFALHRLGLRVGWIGRLGTDVFSRSALELIEREGLDTGLVSRVDQPHPRLTVALSTRRDRAFVSYADPVIDTIQRALTVLPEVAFRHLHLCGLQRGPEVIALVDKARARGASVSLDCDDHDVHLTDPTVADVLRRLDVFLLNASEAQRLTSSHSVSEAGRQLQALAGCVVIKDGAHGAMAWNGHLERHASAMDLEPLDTTGAGDVFTAGFLSAWLQGQALEECLRWGNASGGLSVLEMGGAESAPTRQQVEIALNTYPHWSADDFASRWRPT